jgi:hypothetical protein
VKLVFYLLLFLLCKRVYLDTKLAKLVVGAALLQPKNFTVPPTCRISS